MQTILKVSLWSLVIYFAYCCFLFLMQRQMIFPRYLIPMPSEGIANDARIERLWLHTSWGKIESWFMPPSLEPGVEKMPIVIFAHGNAELIDFWPEELSKFNHLGMGVLLVEYPGYGRSQGTPSQKSITETFIAAYDTIVTRQEVDDSRIVLFGRSLGGGAVCALAAERPSAALILMSTFTSVRSFASRYFVPDVFVRDPFDNLEVVQSYPGPVLIIHGRYDDVIPYEHGIALHQAAKGSQMVTYESQHNDCPPNWEIFWRDVKLFLHGNEILDTIGFK